MQGRNRIVVIGASAGGIESLIALVSTLPENFDAAIFVVLHLSPNHVSTLPQILAKNGRLRALSPVDSELIKTGTIYVAPADHHLLIEKDKVLVRRGPKENRFRPSVDALFRSAAYGYGPNVIGIVLSGALDDGTSGLWSIKHFGGITIVQDPKDAAYDSMPTSALEQVKIDYCLPAYEMGELLMRLIADTPEHQLSPVSDNGQRVEMEVSIAGNGNGLEQGLMKAGPISPFTCPECHGVLVQIEEEKIVRYRCHTGHAYSGSALLSEILEKVDQCSWDAMRSLEEVAIMLEGMERNLSERGRMKAGALFAEQVQVAKSDSQQLHRMIMNRKHFSTESLLSEAGEE